MRLNGNVALGGDREPGHPRRAKFGGRQWSGLRRRRGRLFLNLQPSNDNRALVVSTAGIGEALFARSEGTGILGLGMAAAGVVSRRNKGGPMMPASDAWAWPAKKRTKNIVDAPRLRCI
jgi:hypothetical protein